MKTIRVLLFLFTASLLMPAARAADKMVAAKDHSLTVAEYVKKGVPSPDKVWSPEDYATASTALTAIAKEDPTQLPRFDSPASGALFKRFLDDKNLGIFTDKAVPPDERLGKLSALDSYTPIFMIYINANSESADFDTEIVELGAFIMRVEVTACGVMNEFTTAHPEANSNPQAKEGLATARAGFAESLLGIVTIAVSLADADAPASLRACNHLKTILPALMPVIPAENRDKILAKLNEAVDAQKDPEMKAALKNLVTISTAAK